MKGGRLYMLAILLATISKLQCIPIEVIYTGDGCDCPKSLNYVVNVPTTPKEKSSTYNEHSYKLDAPPIHGKAKVTYTFDFTVQEPKTPSPIEQEKWDLFAKIDRITAHKKDCIAEEGSSNTCSCHKCKSSRRYVSPAAVSDLISRSIHPNSLSKISPEISTFSGPSIAWAALIKPMNGKILENSIHIPNLKNRRIRRDLSHFFLRNRKKQPKKQTLNPKIKQYNKSLQTSTKSDKSKAPNIFSRHGAFQPFGNFMKLPRFRQKRDIKGEYDLIEKERDEMDLTLPEIIQYMPETLNPNFKRGQCQFGKARERQQQTDSEESNDSEHHIDKSNTLASMDKEVKTQEDSDNDEGEDDKHDNSHNDGDSDNDIGSTHTKRNVADYNHSPLYRNYNGPGVYAPSYHSVSAPPPPPPSAPTHNFYTTPLVAAPIHSSYAAPIHSSYAAPIPSSYANPYNPHAQIHQYPYHIPQTRAVYVQPPSATYITGPRYSPPSPYLPVSSVYSPDYQLDSIIAEIINRHSDFFDASYHQGGALVDPPSEQKYQNKALFKTLIGGKSQRYQTDNYYGAPKYRREILATDQLEDEEDE